MGHRDAPQSGVIAMRLLSKKQVRELVLYSFAHIDRMETAGTFPKRVRLGQHRVGWVESEVIDWIEQRVWQRDNPTDGS